jgi:hypothetical protein
MTEEGVAVLAVGLQDRLSADESARLRTSLGDALEELPDVGPVAATLYPPHASSMLGRVAHPDTPDDRLRAVMIPTSVAWFRVLSVRAAAGSTLPDRDEAWRPGDVVLTAALARRLFGSVEASMGRSVLAGSFGREEARVVGVTTDLRMVTSPEEPVEAFFSASMPELPYITLLVRTSASDPAALEELRRTVERVLPDVSVPVPSLLSDRLTEVHSERRIFVTLLGLLAVFTVVLSAVGLYGVVAFALAGRRREIGVRIALGAGGERIVGLVARFAGTVLLVGTVIGLFAGYALSRVLESRLFDVEPFDPPSYGAALVLFTLTSVAACWPPTRRALRVDPVTELRAE